MIGWTGSAADYDELRKEYRELTKKTYSKIHRVLSGINQFVILPGGFVAAIYGILADQLRYIWLLPVLIAAFFLLAALASATSQRDVIEQFGDRVFMEKLLRDDVVVVRGDDLKMGLQTGNEASMHRLALDDAIRHWESRKPKDWGPRTQKARARDRRGR
jgi:hypothetical protein